jgi:hypothetical protein
LYGNRTSGEISHHWQTAIEAGLESGATPLLHAGQSQHLIQHAATLSAYQWQVAHRQDAAEPILPAGGPGTLWLALLFAPQPLHTHPTVVSPTVIFSGADPAAALVGIATTLDGLSTSPYVRHPKILHMFDPTFAPAHYPGRAAPLHTMPFFLATELPGGRIPTGEPVHPDAASGSAHPTAAQHQWVAWAVLLFALFLPLLAMII